MSGIKATSRAQVKSSLGPLCIAMLVLLGVRIAVLVRDLVLSRHAHDLVYGLPAVAPGPDPYFNTFAVVIGLSDLAGVGLMIAIVIQAWRVAPRSWTFVVLLLTAAVFTISGFVGPLKWFQGYTKSVDQLTSTGGYVLVVCLNVVVALAVAVVLISRRRPAIEPNAQASIH